MMDLVLGDHPQAKHWLERSIFAKFRDRSHASAGEYPASYGQVEEAATVIKQVLNEKPHWTVLTNKNPTLPARPLSLGF